MAEHNEAKAAHVYDALNERSDAFSLVAREGSRSNMNITFRTSDAQTDETFLSAAADAGMSGLKGHRSVGGLRASIYNAFPEEGCKQLAQFIREWNG